MFFLARKLFYLINPRGSRGLGVCGFMLIKKKHKLSDVKTRVGLQIFDDKEYLKQRGESRLSKASSSKANSEGGLSGTQVRWSSRSLVH